MDHNICMNSLCLPAKNAAEAFEFLSDTCYGMLDMGTDEDRFMLWYDDEKNRAISQCQLSADYTYQDFLEELKNRNENDLLVFLMETEDKSPALDFIVNENQEIFDELDTCHFYLPGKPSQIYMDTLGIAWLLDATLLSLRTNEIWDKPHLPIARFRKNREDLYSLKNIARQEHGKILRREWEQINELKLEDICPNCRFSEPFIEWYKELNENNRHKVREKLRLASERNFQGGEPLFKVLNDTDGMREIRFSAYPGGAIRILFGAMPGQNQAILIGFIKKRDNEGYEENIPIAMNQWDRLRFEK